MTDNLTKEKRSWNMRRIKGKNTKPELVVRSMLYSMGFRFRIHRKDLPGQPDIVLSKYKTVIFINGCFWHQHEKCKRSNIPKSNKEYWIPKLKRVRERDQENYKALESAGWKVLIVWECMMKDIEELKLFLKNKLEV